MDMGTQGSGRKRLPNRERLTAEDDALNQIAREAEARLAAKRAARAEAREIRMKELERQQKEIYQVQKKYYGLDTKWGDIEQWMEDSERYSRRFRRNTSASDEDERLSVGSRGSLRAQPELEYGSPYAWTNGYDGDYCGSQSLSRRSGRNSSYSGGDGRGSALSSSREEKLGLFCSDLGLPSSGLASKPLSTQNGTRAAMLDDSSLYGARRGSACGSRAPSEYSGHLNSSSRASSRASSARASPVVEERPDKDFAEKSSRNMPSLSAATLASLGGTSSRRGSGDTSISMDTEASIREIKDSLAEVEEKYKKAMVSNAQLDNEKTNFMYQVDTLKDMLLELEEQLAESQRQYEEKNKEFEREKHAHSILQFQFAEVKEALRQREEMLEKHGIILNSEIATNGETSDTVNDVGYQAPTKITKEELNALKSAGEGTLGKAKEVEVKKEIVEKVGQRETLQNSEHEQPKPNTGKDCVDRGVSHPGEKAEDQRPAEDRALSPGPLAGPKCEQQVQSQDQENTSVLKNPEQIELHTVTNKSDGRGSSSPQQSSCVGGLDSEGSGPTEDLKTDLGQGSFEPCPDYVLGQTPEIDKVSCTDSRGTGGTPAEDAVQAGGATVEDQVGTMASGPAEQSKGTENHDERCLKDGMGQSSERELAQEVAEPEEALIQSPQAGGENTVTKAEDAEVRDEKPFQAEVQVSPGAPVVQNDHQDTTGPGSTDAKRPPLHAKERNKQAKSEQQAEALDSPQKRTKNKKKKNKKKKAAAPVETCRDANDELNCQDLDVGDVEEEEQAQVTDKKRAAENPEQKIGAGSREPVEDPQSGPSGKQDEAEGDSPTEGPTGILDQNSPQCEDGDISPVGKKGSQRDASQIGGEEGQVPSQHAGQTVEKAVDGHSLDKSDLSGQLGGFNSESGEQAREEVGNSKNKEDCTMS
ncbi:leucine-rich repeat flightless-interacting protein 1 isoform X6 [Mastomys coucha]|uniref:leucine-rich repeat flightless-interacting protein 1 isoform X6 n=1 Tax=Mastomys coucha TaxID=35658 RepID=UPI0012618875|nr:leucine-rich repeat flightless-interacting protein 1 isoform X6 [Mastomys coucha]